MMISPCFNCEKRKPPCWQYCAEYQAWAADKRAEADSIKPTEADMMKISSVRKWYKAKTTYKGGEQ